jgi:hypothetical protein
MTEEVTLTLYATKDGVTYQGQTITTTVKALAVQKIPDYKAKGNAKACRALVDMLNYGAAVQSTQNYNADKLANEGLGEDAKLGTQETPKIEATNVKEGAYTLAIAKDNISMRSKVEIQLLFATGVDLSKYKIVATVDGEEIGTEIGVVSGYPVVKVAISATNMRKTHTIALYDPATNEPVTQICNVSVEAYAQKAIGTTSEAIAIAMMKYGDAVANI